jgi:hypothetical protein
MPYSPQIYRSPTYAHLPRRAHSFHVEESPSPPQSTYQDVPLGSKHAGSLGRSNKISPHLLSLISKFEALDALSHEIHIPALRSAPLQTSRNSLPRRGGLDGPVSMKLEEIFSPRRKTRQSYGEEFWKDIVASPPENCFMSGLIKGLGSGRLEQIQSANKVNSINLPGGMPPSNLSNPGKKDIWTRIPSYIRVKRDIGLETRNSSIVKERVKFFDGCVERPRPYPLSQDMNSAQGSPLSAAIATNSKAKLSLLQYIPPTTPHHESMDDHHSVAKAPSTISTAGGSRLKATSINSGTPQTPTRWSPTYTKKRQPFEEAPNPFLQTPHRYPPSRRFSPMTASTGQKIDKNHHIDYPLYENSKVLNPVHKDRSLEETNSRRWLQEELLSRPGHSVSKERRIIEKSEAIHRSQGLERAANATASQKVSKYSDMEMLRERSVVARSFESGLWSVSKAIPKPRWRDFSHATPSAPLVRAPYLSCSFAPSDSTIQFQSHFPNLAKRSTTIKAGRVSTKIPQVSGKRIPGLVHRTQVCPSNPPKAVCRSSHDQIKRWERKKEIRERIEEDRPEIRSSRPLAKFTAARRSIYENQWNEEVEKELEKRGLDGQEVQAVMNEFQDIGGGVGDNTTKGTWKMVVASRLGRGGFATQDNGGTDDAFVDVNMQIIVREAQCGLAEPKPLRLLEMKRMILLCREVDSGNARPGCKDRGSRQIL